MSQLTGGKIALQLQTPGRCRMHYQILVKGEVIGEVELDHIAWRSGEAELKIHIFDPAKRRRGFGSDAVTTLLEHAFGTMNLRRVYLRVHATNTAAVRCYEKAGFRKEGKLKRSFGGERKEEVLLMAVSRQHFSKERPARAV